MRRPRAARLLEPCEELVNQLHPSSVPFRFRERFERQTRGSRPLVPVDLQNLGQPLADGLHGKGEQS